MACEVKRVLCKRCRSERIIKNGFRDQKQCYLCRDCRHQFVSERGWHTPQEEKAAVLLFCFGLSLTAIARVLLVHPSTVMRWVRKYAKDGDKKSAPQGEITVDLNELWHYVRSEKAGSGFQKLTVAPPERRQTESAAPEKP